jgi:hypothetical protein
MEVAPLRVKDLPEHRSDRGREPDSLSDGFVRLKRESGFGLFEVDIRPSYRIVSGQSDEWRLLFFVRLAIELLTAGSQAADGAGF